MGDFQHKNNTGTAFANKWKQPGDNKPDFKGEAMIDGVLKEIAIWKKPGNKGEYFSLKIQDPRPSQGGGGGGGSQAPRQADPYDQGDANF